MKFFIYISSILASVVLVHFTGITKETFFDINNQMAYLGVLIGFALTLYTFGLSVLKDIYEIIEGITFKKIENKQLVFQELKNSFGEIKSDIVLIFICIVFLFINAVIRNSVNPFGWDVEHLKIPEIISITIFLWSTFALLDVMKALFNLSDLIFKK